MSSESLGSRILESKILDDKLVRRLCFGGVEGKYRALVWRVVLQIVGLRRDVYQDEVNIKNSRYLEILVSSLQKNNEEVRGRSRHNFEFQISKRVMHQIDIDIKRIDVKYKTHLGMDISYMYYNILSLVAYRRPSLGYIQGMSDILVPFILVFSQENMDTAESSSYFCYSRLLDEIQHNIIELQITQIRRLDSIIEIADPDFHKLLREMGLEIHMFAFRWFNCFFVREFKFPVLYKILDTMFASESTSELLLYFAVALLMSFKPVLAENDFSSSILLLQNMHEKEWEDAEIELLLSSARFYRKMVCEHLSSHV